MNVMQKVGVIDGVYRSLSGPGGRVRPKAGTNRGGVLDTLCKLKPECWRRGRTQKFNRVEAERVATMQVEIYFHYN